MRAFTIYTDGACSGNGQEGAAGGWAAVLISDRDRFKEISGGEKNTTNQRMELKAAIEALKEIKTPSSISLYSDSAYLVNCFKQSWHKKWVENGWKNSKGEPVANQDLWEELLALTAVHQIEFWKVKGHTGEMLNERCDELARAAVPK